MLPGWCVLVGAALSLVGSLRYCRLTLAGRTRPNRVTWALWAAAPLIGFAAQLDEGVGLPSVLTLSIGVGPALVLAASVAAPAAYWRIRPFDVACGAVSVLALVVWLTLPDPTAAVVVAVVADAVAGLPTLRKAWTAPETEAAAPFVLVGANGAITLLTLDRWAVADWAFAAYVLVLGWGLATLVLLRTRAVVAGRADRADRTDRADRADGTASAG